MTTPFTFTGALQFPPDPGGPLSPIAIAFAGSFTQLVAETLQLTGSGTKTLDLSSLNGGLGANLVLIKVDAQSTPQTVNLRWNGGASTGEQEVSTGGFFVLGSGAPSAGLASLILAYTSSVTVRIWALGG